MLSKPIRKREDCGCGGGKDNCISKSAMQKFIQAELKRLDCGCGCRGVKGFQKKYGVKLVGGKILADCPPGWRNDGLTCVENCNADERDDGLTCRKRCPEGQIDDGLTCRVPIRSAMNDCPPGSRDIIGTCWGPKHQWCVDDCFKHPAPGCKTWECGRLKGLFGEDWGPRLCTDCNLRCGQTCWWTDGITKQLHERELRLWGGEVYGQAIRGKQIRGRVNFAELGKAIESGLAETFGKDSAFAKLFDPEQNGVGAAFRKFGDDIKRVVEDVANKIKDGFDKMGADIKKAFEDFAKDAESKFKQFGDDFVRMMKDPDFWVEAIGIMAQIAAAAVSIAITVGTLGAGTGLAVGLMAAAQMAGPAAKMIADAARGRPIDALDIISLAASAATAMVPGMSATVGAMVKTGANAAKYAVQGTQMAQALNLIPSTCIANCPPQPPFPPEPPIEPTPPPSDLPPPPGQKTDAEILDLAPPCTFLRVIGKPNQPAPCNVPPKVTRSGPPYYTDAEWIAKYRADNYGPGAANQTVEDESGALVDKNDDDIKGEVDTTKGEQIDITDVEVPELGEIDFGEPTGEIDFGEPTGEIDFGEPIGDIDFGEELGAGKKRRKKRGGQLGPVIEPITINGVVTNPGGMLFSLPAKANIPRDHTGAEFNVDCYARKNPELAASVGNDKNKLTSHWLEVGSKEGWDASCGATSSKEERLKAFQDLAKREVLNKGLKASCKALDRFWEESTLKCDGTRNANGSANTFAEECKSKNSLWDHEGNISFCNVYKNDKREVKTPKERCNTINNYWDGSNCNPAKNVDGKPKTKGDLCSGLNNYWDGMCNIDKDNDGKLKSEKKMCNDLMSYYGPSFWISKATWGQWNKVIDLTEYFREKVTFANTSSKTEYVRDCYKQRNPDLHHMGQIDVDSHWLNHGQREGKYGSCEANDLIIPAFDFTDDWIKMGRPDPAPDVGKWFTIYYSNATGNHVFNTNWGWQQMWFTGLKLQAGGPDGCNQDYFPSGRVKSREFIRDVVDLGQPHGQVQRYPHNYESMRNYMKSVEDSAEFKANEQVAKETSNVEPPRGSGKGKKSLTLYWANGCSHCHNMMPEWEKLGKTHKGVKIQAIERGKLKRKDIAGFPTILFSDGQREIQYEGPRTKSGFVNFLKNNL
jgi:thiol-disulfide isomerase/thioredoxin